MQKYLVLAISIPVAIAIVCVLSPTFDRHEGTAAWVQAVGSIVAIMAATWIAGRDSREARKRDTEKRRQLWESVATISENGISAFKKLNDACQAPGNQRENFIDNYVPSDFNVPIDGLTSIPLHEIGDTALITHVVMFLGILRNVQKKLEAEYQNLTNPLVGFNLDFLKNQKTSIFNAYANIWRTVYPDRETDLSKFV